jgi:uncharacterized protein YoxC
MSKKDNENTSHYEEALLEDIQHKLARLAEVMTDVPQDVRQLKVNMDEVNPDIKATKAAVSDQSKQLADHEHRITNLEKVTA